MLAIVVVANVIENEMVTDRTVRARLKRGDPTTQITRGSDPHPLYHPHTGKRTMKLKY
jgi:hypothetical protein